MSYNIFRNFGYLLEPVLSDLVETEKHANSFVAYCISCDSLECLPCLCEFNCHLSGVPHLLIWTSKFWSTPKVLSVIGYIS